LSRSIESEQTAGLKNLESHRRRATLEPPNELNAVSATPGRIGSLDACGVNEACLTSDAGGSILGSEIETETVNGQNASLLQPITTRHRLIQTNNCVSRSRELPRLRNNRYGLNDHHEVLPVSVNFAAGSFPCGKER